MESHLEPYLPVLVLLPLTGVLCALIAVGATLLGPRRQTVLKSTAFECGNPSEGEGHHRHSVKFYLVALLFIVFDIESVFVYPWGALLRDLQGEGLGWFAYGEMLSFMVTLALGLVYVWRKGALDWSSQPDAAREPAEGSAVVGRTGALGKGTVAARTVEAA